MTLIPISRLQNLKWRISPSRMKSCINRLRAKLLETTSYHRSTNRSFRKKLSPWRTQALLQAKTLLTSMSKPNKLKVSMLRCHLKNLHTGLRFLSSKWTNLNLKRSLLFPRESTMSWAHPWSSNSLLRWESNKITSKANQVTLILTNLKSKNFKNLWWSTKRKVKCR